MSLFDALTADYKIPPKPRRLDPDQIREIRRLYAGGAYRQVDLAAEYGVHQSEISRIVNRKRRRSVE